MSLVKGCVTSGDGRFTWDAWTAQDPAGTAYVHYGPTEDQPGPLFPATSSDPVRRGSCATGWVYFEVMKDVDLSRRHLDRRRRQRHVERVVKRPPRPRRTTVRPSTAGRCALAAGAAALLALATTPANAAPAIPGSTVTHVAHYASLGSGSTIGPDGALYVTDGAAGTVDRVDLRTGTVTTYAGGLPAKVLAIGGAMDVAFLRGQMYVLVTMVGGDIVGGPHLGDATVGIYRMDGPDSFTAIADVGSWSAAHPPTTSWFITTGVQYAMTPDRDGFLVTDGHHNRILHVGLDGSIRPVLAFEDVVPTGLEREGDRMWFTEAGPIPHAPEAGAVFTAGSRGSSREVARGARLAVDVELGPRHDLYVLSQGVWDGVGEGTPALPGTGRIYRVGKGGHLVAVHDGNGADALLDRPTSMELVGDTAYVVSLTGDVYAVQGLR